MSGMLPDSFIELFEMTGSDDFPSPGTNDDELAGLTYSLIRCCSVIQLASIRFATERNFNQADFRVLFAIMSASDRDITVTPGFIAERMSLSASTLTSILERLSERGYIVRDKDDADKRRIALYYTERAAQIAVDFYRHVGLMLTPIADERRNEIADIARTLQLVADVTTKTV